MSYTCTACKEECYPRIEDYGIGPYEYWGAKGVDKLEIVESDCCGEAVVDEYGVLLTIYQFRQELETVKAEHLADRM